MIDVNIQYKLVIFTNKDEIIATPQIISSLIEVFQDKSFIPNTFLEFTTGKPQTRVRLSTTDDEWVILFPTNKIEIQKTMTDAKGGNLGELSQFTADAIEFTGRILNKFKTRATRIALVTNSLLEEMTEEKLAEVYNTLFNPPQFYKDSQPFEWNFRSASHISIEIGGLSESLNVITLLNRIRGQLGIPSGITQLDRIQMSLDINTIPENIEGRFELRHINEFCQNALDLHSTLSKQIQEHINVK